MYFDQTPAAIYCLPLLSVCHVRRSLLLARPQHQLDLSIPWSQRARSVPSVPSVSKENRQSRAKNKQRAHRIHQAQVRDFVTSDIGVLFSGYVWVFRNTKTHVKAPPPSVEICGDKLLSLLASLCHQNPVFVCFVPGACAFSGEKMTLDLGNSWYLPRQLLCFEKHKTDIVVEKKRTWKVFLLAFLG